MGGIALQSTNEVGSDLRKEFRNNFRYASTQMLSNGEIVHLRQTFVDAHETQVRVNEAQSYGGTIVNCLELRESLCG
jgi:hypothetical protein